MQCATGLKIAVEASPRLAGHRKKRLRKKKSDKKWQSRSYGCLLHNMATRQWRLRCCAAPSLLHFHATMQQSESVASRGKDSELGIFNEYKGRRRFRFTVYLQYHSYIGGKVKRGFGQFLIISALRPCISVFSFIRPQHFLNEVITMLQIRCSKYKSKTSMFFELLTHV